MSDKLPIYEIKLTRGLPLHNELVDLEAPPIPGFIALVTWIPCKDENDEHSYKRGTKYINLSHIEEMSLTQEAQSTGAGNYLARQATHKAKVER